jgi:hypothetical protein
MTDCEELWKTNLHLAQSINALTADIVKLKQNEREKKENERVIEDLKSKYYVTLADLNQERIKKKNTMRLWHRLFFWKN